MSYHSSLGREFYFFLLMLCLLFPIIASAEPASTVYRAEAHRATQPIEIDGKLDEPDWQSAKPIDKFAQVMPDEGASVTQPTEVRILYDEQNIYFGFTCYDSDMSKVVANVMRRDGFLYDNDNVFVVLDTYGKERNGYFFRTNPLGTEQESVLTNSGSSVNWNWDAVWRCEGLINEDNWTVEMAIPFSQLRFNHSDSMVWGLNLGRKVMRNEEDATWVPMPRAYGRWASLRLVDIGSLVGLDGIPPSRNLEFLPYILPGFSRVDQGKIEVNRVLDLGLDLKYGVTANLTADLTLNTDFAQVEADEEQVNLTRFSLYFPEKRPFFLEGAGLFEFGIERPGFRRPPPLLLFHSRRIGLAEEHTIPIIGGGKATGKVGSYGIGFLNVYTDEFYSGEPVAEEDEVIDVARTNYSILRVKRDIFDRSSVGLIAINKQDAETYNRSGGVDFAYRPHDKLNLNGLWARTFDADISGENDAFHFGGNWQGSQLRVRGSYTEIDDNFNPEAGFVLREGIRQIRGGTRYRRWPRRVGIRRVDITPEFDYVLNQANELVTRKLALISWTGLESGDWINFRVRRTFERLEEDFEIREGIVIPAAEYHFTSYRAGISTDESLKISGDLRLNAGDFFNGTRRGFEVRAEFKPNRHLSFRPQYQFDRVTVSGKSFNAIVFRSRLLYTFSTRLLAKLFAQWNNEENTVTTNVLLNYIYRPGSNFFLVFNQIYDRVDGQVTPVDSTVVAKMTYWWNP